MDQQSQSSGLMQRVVGGETNLNPSNRDNESHVRQKRNVIIAFVAALVVVVVAVVIWQTSKSDSFISNNRDYILRQNGNPFTTWSTTEHESQTTQVPINIPIHQQHRGAITQYMATRNPVLD